MSFKNYADTSDIISTISRTGYWNGKPAYVLKVLGNRSGTFSDITTLNDVCEFLASGEFTYTPPTTSDTFVVNSTSPNDTANGTNTRSVAINYLDANGDAQEVIVELNGTSDVTIPEMANNCTFVQNMHAQTHGANTSSAGNIILYNTAKTVKYEQITAGGNMSLSARYRVPANCMAYVIEWSMGAVRQGHDVRLRSNTDTPTRDDVLDGFLFQDILYLGEGENIQKHQPWLRIPAGAEVKVSATVLAVGNVPRVDTSFTVVCVEA